MSDEVQRLDEWTRLNDSDRKYHIQQDYTGLKQQIEQYVSILQRLPQESRWIYAAAQNSVQALSQGKPVSRGLWEMRARRLLRIMSAVRLRATTIAIVNFVLCLHLYLAQFRHSVGAIRFALFVGINALRERSLYNHFEQIVGEPAEYIDERDMSEFFRHGHVSLSDLFNELTYVWRQAANAAGRSPGLSALDVCTIVLMRAHKYAFLRAWFKRHLQTCNGRTFVACTAASLVSHAAVTAGVKTIYMLHGFQRHSLVYPNFAECFCFTAFEANHLRRRLPGARVELRCEWQPFVETCRVAAIAGVDSDPAPERIRPFINWALQNNLPVMVRPHPADRSGYWDRWRQVRGITILEPVGRIEEFLATFRPRLLASWYSTALHDAFVTGVIPVTVSRVDEDVLDTVFPIREISLRWPTDVALALKLIDSERARADFFVQRRELVIGGANSQPKTHSCSMNGAESRATLPPRFPVS